MAGDVSMSDRREELDLANAALGLGDNLIPPMGVICRVSGKIYETNTSVDTTIDMMIVRAYDQRQPMGLKGLPMEYDGTEWVNAGIRAKYFDRSSIIRFWYIPSWCPAFRDWKREPNERQNNLIVVNSALRLGDLFVPPIGSVFSTVYEEDPVRKIMKVRDFLVKAPGRFGAILVTKSTNIFWWGDCWVENPHYQWSVHPSEMKDVLSVPLEAEPFERWKRCEKDKEAGY